MDTPGATKLRPESQRQTQKRLNSHKCAHVGANEKIQVVFDITTQSGAHVSRLGVKLNGMTDLHKLASETITWAMHAYHWDL